MTRKTLHGIAAATASLALIACANSATLTRESTMPNASATAASRLMPVKQWPLRFRSHSFSARCYDTDACRVWYANAEHGDDKPSPPSSKYGPEYLANWSGGHLGVQNFPPPAQVNWRSKDGKAHQAEIDIGAIFQDELIRHGVQREEMSEVADGEFQGEPAILLEVNDRTIRVYMRAMIHLKRQVRVGDHMRGDFRHELILVKTFMY